MSESEESKRERVVSSPVPLTDPSGTVRAWMCGCCGHIGVGSVPIYRDADADYIEGSLLRAAACCVCSECKGPNPRTDRDSSLYCRACTAKRDEDIRAAFAERKKTHTWCGACEGDGYDHLDTSCVHCGGAGWVKREEPQP